MCVGEYASMSILGELDEMTARPSEVQPNDFLLNRPTYWQIAGCQNLCSRITIGLSHFEQTTDSFSFLDNAISNGYMTFDCAVHYKGTIPFGAWLKTKSAEVRKNLFIIGKCAHPIGMMQRIKREYIFEDIKILLNLLGTSYIDCLMLHRDDPSVPVENIVQWLNEIVDAGLANSYGFSNWTLQRIQKAQMYAYSTGLLLAGLVSNYSGPPWKVPPWPGCVQMDAEETRFVAEELKIPYLAWSPITPILDMAKQYKDSNHFEKIKKELIESEIKKIFAISGKVGIVLRTTSMKHLSQIVMAEAL